ncbi:hypothetical protein [Arthrobacter crystallopoietes]|uniref:hypothetical protein n=1 Tax=Crystallibacter crystallopoietes TaxID=37928 RepID=UPI001F0F96E2|nr:hypothetical protein [Arthrobacter crystallopoietes]
MAQTSSQQDNQESGYIMQIDKRQILDLLRSTGDTGKAEQAEKDLPDQVDTERDSGLLSNLGIDVNALLSKLPGGLGDKLGGLGDKLGGFGR